MEQARGSRLDICTRSTNDSPMHCTTILFACVMLLNWQWSAFQSSDTALGGLHLLHIKPAISAWQAARQQNDKDSASQAGDSTAQRSLAAHEARLLASLVECDRPTTCNQTCAAKPQSPRSRALYEGSDSRVCRSLRTSSISVTLDAGNAVTSSLQCHRHHPAPRTTTPIAIAPKCREIATRHHILLLIFLLHLA